MGTEEAWGEGQREEENEEAAGGRWASLSHWALEGSSQGGSSAWGRAPPGQAGGRLLAARMGGHRAWAHTTACADHMLF